MIARRSGAAGRRTCASPRLGGKFDQRVRPTRPHPHSLPPAQRGGRTQIAHFLAFPARGTKRTVYVAYRTFLVLNGVEIAASADDKYVTMLALAEGSLELDPFAAWLRRRCTPLPGRDAMQEPAPRYRAASRR